MVTATQSLNACCYHHCHQFLKSYTEENAILLPGRIPGYKRDDIKLLPSSCSKKV